MDKKRSFWERLTGSVPSEQYEEPRKIAVKGSHQKEKNDWIEEENEEAELAVDLYQTNEDIIVQTFVAGVKSEDIELSVTRDTVTVKGKRDESRIINEDDYFAKELYWGRFSRTI